MFLYFLPPFFSATFNILSTPPHFVKNFLEKLLKKFPSALKLYFSLIYIKKKNYLSLKFKFFQSLILSLPKSLKSVEIICATLIILSSSFCFVKNFLK